MPRDSDAGARVFGVFCIEGVGLICRPACAGQAMEAAALRQRQGEMRSAHVVKALVGAVASLSCTLAMAYVSVGVSVGVPLPVYGPPAVVYAAPPVYVAPVPSYAPPPVIYQPAPAYIAPTASISIGWYGNRYWDGRRYWNRDDWYRHNGGHPDWGHNGYPAHNGRFGPGPQRR